MKYVYAFHEGNKDMRELLGGKGANLAEMTRIGLPVPQGFTVTTEACNKYYDDGEKLSEEVIKEIYDCLKELEKISGKNFDSFENTLLLSVRSGARASMPGMMDTILNLGLNDEIADHLARETGNPRFIYDSYRRFIQMYADVVDSLPKESFERRFDLYKEENGYENDLDLDASHLLELINIYKSEYQSLTGREFPQDPKYQLIEAIKAVFRSWDNERANTYRKMNNIPHSWGTAVNIQEMVYGNKNDNSGTGVAFTRNPATGENVLFGEYLINAQGEDVVAGIRTPDSIDHLKDFNRKVYDEFRDICMRLEHYYKDMQDMEFTIEDGKLYMLQTRNGKRTGVAALKIAVDMVEEGLITKEEAILKVDPKGLDQLLHPAFDQDALKEAEIKGTGLAASPGAASGRLYFEAHDLKKAKERGEDNLILARLETSPEDIEGMAIAKGILTLRGGMTSHAAVVARGMGTCCVSGCSDIKIDEEKKTLTFKDGTILKEGDYISLDGSTGNVYAGSIKTKEAEISGDFEKFMKWTDEVRRLKVKANADNKKDTLLALKFGAEGIGLCRTEHMFFDEKRIFSFREMILADSEEARKVALSKILPFQRNDFVEIFMAAGDADVIIRFLDPPLHEFLPKEDEEIENLASDLGKTYEEVKDKIASLKEFNPMMGHRGCRLSITYPEIARMQTRAVIEALIISHQKGSRVIPKIMIPLIGDINEFKFIKKIVDDEARDILYRYNMDLPYEVGTMIEVPRACLLAGEIARVADFYSFGTNDLTQMAYGFSRDDAGKFLNDYYDKKIFDNDPFMHVDEKGVGELIKIAIKKAKEVKEDISLGICGEHGGDPDSITFFDKIGLEYVSCSPFRIPIARLAAAQAYLKNKNK